GMRMSPSICMPSTTRNRPPIRVSQYTISPAYAPTSATATQSSVNTEENPSTNASACVIVRARCVPARAASPAMSTRNAGTSGSTQGERNERMPAPNAIATFMDRSGSGSADRLREIGDQIVHRLDPDRQPNEASRRRELGAAHRAVSHRQRHFDQRLDTAE